MKFKKLVLRVKDYDENGDYVKTWVPELSKVPARKVHEPWTLSKEEQQAAGVVIGKDYPFPTKSRYSRDGEGPTAVSIFQRLDHA